MDDSLNPFARQSAHEVIVAKRDRLLAERADLIDQRSAILMRIRRADRELADCRAAARLFDLNIEFPEDDERASHARREHEAMAEREERIRYMERRRLAEEQNRLVHLNASAVPGDKVPQLAQPKSPAAQPSPVRRPPLREIVLEQLKITAPAERKAAELREYIERTYGEIIHEKTVGMTLYRLSKEGLVRRDGHNWFLGTVQAETGNPGVVAPGVDELFK